MIINDIETLKSYIATIADAEFSQFKQHLVSAELYLKREIVGESLFDLIDEPNDLLIEHCRNIVANKAYLEAIPFMDLVSTANGFAVIHTDTLTPASPARVSALKQGTEERLNECIEDLLEYLEAHNQFHDDWKGSKTYSLISENFISSLREFRRYARFDQGRLEFIKVLPTLSSIKKLKIETVISTELCEQIIEQIRDNELSSSNKRIVDDIRFALANYAINNEAVGDSFIAKVKKFLLNNIPDYPVFAASDIYKFYTKANTAPEDPQFLSCI